MKVSVVKTRYCAELSANAIRAIVETDVDNEKRGVATLKDFLSAIGAQEVVYDIIDEDEDWQNIYFSLPEDMQDQFANIILMIYNYSEIATRKVNGK